MRSEAEQPPGRGGDGLRDDETAEFAAGDPADSHVDLAHIRAVLESETAEMPAINPSAGLFDPNGSVRPRREASSHQQGPESQRQHRQPRLGAGTVLGGGPEIARNIGNRGAPFVPTPPVAELPIPVVERVLDGVYRWRTVFGLGLAAVMTVGVVAVYQGPGSDDGVGAQSRSAITAGDELAVETEPIASTGSNIDPPAGSQVNSAIGETDPASPTTGSPDGPSSTRVTASATTESTQPPSSTEEATTTLDPSTTSETTTTEASSTSDTTPTTAESTTSSSEATTSTTTTPTTAPPLLRAEAESGVPHGAAVADQTEAGFSGAGYITKIVGRGDGISIVIDTPLGGSTPFRIRYSAGPVDGLSGLRTLSIAVNGTRITEAQMQPTVAWSTWDTVGGSIDLAPGTNTITLIVEAGDTGNVAIDYIEIN